MTRLIERGRNAALLLVEDNAGDVVLFRRALERAGVSIDLSVVRSAEEALVMLQVEHRYPDLIVLDLNLPHMSGLEFLDVVKNDPELRRIPVLVFSSSTSDADIAASYDRYASGYLSKPMGPSDYDTILKTVEAYWFRLLQTSPAEGDRARLRREPESDDNR